MAVSMQGSGAVPSASIEQVSVLTIYTSEGCGYGWCMSRKLRTEYRGGFGVENCVNSENRHLHGCELGQERVAAGGGVGWVAVFVTEIQIEADPFAVARTFGRRYAHVVQLPFKAGPYPCRNGSHGNGLGSYRPVLVGLPRTAGQAPSR